LFSKSESHYDRRSVVYFVAPSLTRGLVCNLLFLLVSPAQSRSGLSGKHCASRQTTLGPLRGTCHSYDALEKLSAGTICSPEVYSIHRTKHSALGRCRFALSITLSRTQVLTHPFLARNRILEKSELRRGKKHSWKSTFSSITATSIFCTFHKTPSP
jgi:hypothetical protein